MAYSDIPIRIKESYSGGSNASFDANDLAQFAPTDERNIAYNAGKYVLSNVGNTGADIYRPGWIGVISSGGTSIGTYSDTKYNELDGTHPASAISLTTTTTTLSQKEPDITSLTTANDKLGNTGLPDVRLKYPVVWDTDLESFRLPTFPEIESMADRMNSYIATNNYPGLYYLGSSAPSDGDTWKVAQSSVFSDTINSGTVVDYNIYVKSDMASPPSADTYNRPMFIWKGNTEEYDTDTTSIRQHGLNEQIAMETITTVRYSAIYPSTIIYEKETDGTVNTVTTTSSSGPERGSFNVTAGRSYYGSKPIELHRNADGNIMVPWSMRGREFGNYSNRYGDSTFFFFAKEACTVYMYINEANGVDGTATRTISLSANSVHTETVADADSNNNWIFITSTKDIVASVQEESGDRSRLAPAENVVYRSYSQYQRTTKNTNPTDSSGNKLTDTNGYNIVALRIGDGAGGDMVQHLGESILSNTFSWGDALKDYKNRIQVTLVPNITNICYGRGVGYKIEEIVLDEKTQQISATKIREQMRKEAKLK